MKRILFYIAAAAFGLMPAVSCTPQEESFNEAFLYSGSGAWEYTDDAGDGPEDFRDTFRANGTGMTEFLTNGAPSQDFTWELIGAELTITRQTTTRVATRAAVPWTYTVESLTETEMVLQKPSGNGTLTYIKQQ
jgi:hypothetical protein